MGYLIFLIALWVFVRTEGHWLKRIAISVFSIPLGMAAYFGVMVAMANLAA